jgi:hypothetical protein
MVDCDSPADRPFKDDGHGGDCLMLDRRVHILIAISFLRHGGAKRLVIPLLRRIDPDKVKLKGIVQKGGPVLPLMLHDVSVVKPRFPQRMPQLASGRFLMASSSRRPTPDSIINNLINMDFYCVFGRILSRSNANLAAVNQSYASMTHCCQTENCLTFMTSATF